MVMVQPGNEAFVSLAHKVRGDKLTQAVSVVQKGDECYVSLVTFDKYNVTKRDHKDPCHRKQVAALISRFGLEDPLCLLHFKVKGEENRFGWVVVHPVTLDRVGEREFYNGVI